MITLCIHLGPQPFVHPIRLACADLLYYCFPVTPMALISCLYFQCIYTELDMVHYVFAHDPQ